MRLIDRPEYLLSQISTCEYRSFFLSNWIAPATRPALLSFREQWINDGGLNTGLDINRCTVYGGLCEHPEQLKYCISAIEFEKKVQ